MNFWGFVLGFFAIPAIMLISVGIPKGLHILADKTSDKFVMVLVCIAFCVLVGLFVGGIVAQHGWQ